MRPTTRISVILFTATMLLPSVAVPSVARRLETPSLNLEDK